MPIRTLVLVDLVGEQRPQRHDLVVSHVSEILEGVWSFAESADWVERMRHADVDAVLVTRSDGRLLGLFERRRAEHALQETG